MRAIMTIARRDFRSTFLSPKAGAIFFVFLLFMGLFFYSFIGEFLQIQMNSAQTGGQGATLEQLLKAIFYNLHFVMILIIPAVTMATFSEEKKTHTLRLMQSAPISASHIVLGKFIAVVGVMSIVLFASMVFPAFLVKFGNPDMGVILTSYLGVFLLIMAQLAFGLWVSSLTSHQFMAFIFTMLGLFALLILNWLAKSISQGASILESVLKYLASTEHLDSFLKGMISVADVTYFVCFTALFLFLTNVVLDSQRWR